MARRRKRRTARKANSIYDLKHGTIRKLKSGEKPAKDADDAFLQGSGDRDRVGVPPWWGRRDRVGVPTQVSDRLPSGHRRDPSKGLEGTGRVKSRERDERITTPTRRVLKGYETEENLRKLTIRGK